MGRSFTLVSYNIHKGMSPLNRKVILDDLKQELSKLAPDVLCLQEVQGQNLKRAVQFNEYPDQAQHEWFGEYLAFNGEYGKNVAYPHGHHGNAVLSKFPLDPKHNVNISVGTLEKRGVLHCEIDVGGQRIVVLNAHLNLLHRDRIKQYQAISDYIYNEIDPAMPLILAGDFNDWTKKSSEFLADLGLVEVFENLHEQSPKTFPARLPVLSLDRIYVKNLTIKQAVVHSGMPWQALSDHLPISAVLET